MAYEVVDRVLDSILIAAAFPFQNPLSISESISVSCNKIRIQRSPLRRRVRWRRMRSAAVTGSLALLLIAGVRSRLRARRYMSPTTPTHSAGKAGLDLN
jgi:hypothetical protein